MAVSQNLGAFGELHSMFVDGARIAYRVQGQGPAVVLLHGYPLNSLTFRHLVPLLSEDFACCAFDLIGLGGSASDRNWDYSSLGQAELLQHAVRGLGVRSYTLIGNDSGGWVARELALIDAANVNSLILTNTEVPDHRPPWVTGYQQLARLPGAAAIFRRFFASRRWRYSTFGFGNCFEDPDSIDGEFGELFVLPLLQSRERMEGALRFLREMKFSRLDEFRHLHAKLTMPAAFLWAGADPTFPELEARRMAAQFPRVVRFVSIPKSKLFLHEERPEVVSAEVRTFMSAVRETGALTT